MEVAYFTLSGKHLYVNLDRLLGTKAILAPHKIIRGGPCPLPHPPVPTPFARNHTIIVGLNDRQLFLKKKANTC